MDKSPKREFLIFLFTDIEGSAALWDKQASVMSRHQFRHNELIGQAVTQTGGRVFNTVGDGLYVVFESIASATRAALVSQLALLAEDWGEYKIRVRMAIHAGYVESDGGDYDGSTLSRVSRILDLGHGGQILVSESIQVIGSDDLPADCTLREIGTFRLRGLEKAERIFQLIHPDLPTDFPALRHSSDIPTNVTLPATSFVGRDKDIAAIAKKLGRTRIITLTGTAGTGKSRLALQTASALATDYSDGVWHVDYSEISDDDAVASMLMSVLKVRGSLASATQNIVSYLRPLSVLLILDNCERVRTGCQETLAAVVARCPGVHVLVTNREPIGVPGEQIVPVSPLPLPVGTAVSATKLYQQSAAVQLFVDRAAMVRDGFQLNEGNASYVAAICRRLDGIPLAIELIAARTNVLSPRELLERLDLRLGTSGKNSGGKSHRHSTMQAAIEWSYDTLSPACQELLLRLTVFSGGCTLKAAEEICSDVVIPGDDVLELLSQLVEKSLVTVTEHGDGSRRFGLLEVIRRYALERRIVDPGGDLEVRHTNWYLQFANEQSRSMSKAETLENLDCEFGNMMAAFDFQMASGDYEAALDLTYSLWQFWAIRGYLREGTERMSQVLAATSSPTPTRAAVLMGNGVLLAELGDYSAALSYLDECVSILRTQNEPEVLAAALGNLALIYQHLDQADQARLLYVECLSIFRQLGNGAGASMVLGNLGLIGCMEGDFEQAKRDLDESALLSKQHGAERGYAVAVGNLGLLYYMQGRYQEACRANAECITIFERLGDKGGVASALNSYGRIAAMLGMAAESIRLSSFAEQLCEQIGLKAPHWEITLSARTQQLIGASMPPAEAQRYRQEGLDYTLQDALAAGQMIYDEVKVD
jgi:predicted ATPase/class 3 adenylate cyclase